jgi:hypothetical protein
VERLEFKVGAGHDCSGCKNPGAPMVVGGREAVEDDSDLDVERDLWIALVGKERTLQQAGFPQVESLVALVEVL